MAQPVPGPAPDDVADACHRLLVSRMCRCEEPALAELYDTLASRVYGLAMRIVHQPALAEEVVEDTFFQIWREANRFDSSRGKVIAWVLTICRSRALDALRRIDLTVLMEQPEELRAEVESAFIDPASILEQFETGSAVRDALAALPARERQVVALAFFRGMTHQEIADSWSMPLGSVKTLLRRAFGQLREQLAATASGRMEFL
jgi:RNA polymerase sigma factor (sigma-70 family)